MPLKEGHKGNIREGVWCDLMVSEALLMCHNLVDLKYLIRFPLQYNLGYMDDR